MFESFMGHVCRSVCDFVDTSFASLLYSCTTDAVFSEVHVARSLDQWTSRERRA